MEDDEDDLDFEVLERNTLSTESTPDMPRNKGVPPTARAPSFPQALLLMISTRHRKVP